MRIIGGRLRGRDLGPVPEGVRPTSDRVRESLFSVLGDLEGMRVLDLFAGTGALGLEAFSRGASELTLVDRSRPVVRALRKRLTRLGLDDEPGISVLAIEADRAIRRLAAAGRRFDLVFLDPPYAGDERETTLDLVFEAGILLRDATVVVEGPKRHPVAARPSARLVEERRYGETVLTWLAPAGAHGE